MIILPQTGITSAVSLQRGPIYQLEPDGSRNLLIAGTFNWGSGGTSVDAWWQSSFDGNAWFDIANMHWTTAGLTKAYNLSGMTPVTTSPTFASGALAANSCVDGMIGDYLSVLYTTVGTYGANTNLQLWANGCRIRAQ